MAHLLPRKAHSLPLPSPICLLFFWNHSLSLLPPSPLSLPLSTESRRLEAMKIMSLRPPFFGSSKKKTCSVSRSVDSSFGSNASSEDSESTPKSVLPCYPAFLPWPRRRNRRRPAATSGGPRRRWTILREGRITRRELEVVLRHLGSDPPTEEEVVFL